MKLPRLSAVLDQAYDTMPQYVKYTADAVSWGIIGATLAKILPPIAALASLIWTCIQVYEWYKKKRTDK